MTTFLFLRITHDLSAVAPRSGDTRRAAHSSVQSWPRCRFLLLAQVFPTAIPRLPRHLPHGLPTQRVQCRLTCTGLWTERRTCPRNVAMLFGRRPVECVRLAHADDVPLLILPEDTRCRRCDRLPGNEPRYRRFGPTEAHVAPAPAKARRHRLNQGAFHRCERGHVKGLLLPLPASASRSRRPHVAPMAGDNVPCRALQARGM